MSDEHLCIRARTGLAEFELSVDEAFELAGVTAIFGPSGGGKTTLLRLIAGFENPLSGRISMGRAVWFDAESGVRIPAHRRPVGYMFQDARLFHHLTVLGNLRYADDRCARQENRYGVEDIMEAFDLRTLLHRRIGSLSGGERQRVALARTLLTRPDLLLLDEPLAALDRARKIEILPYLEALPKRFGVPTFYVSHDIEEVSRLADKILVLSKGRVDAYGPAADIMARLDVAPLSDRFEASALLEGRVVRHDARLRLTYVAVGEDTISMPINERLAPGDVVRLRIRARDVAIAAKIPEGLSIRNRLPGRIAAIDIEEETPFAHVVIAHEAGPLRASVTRAAVEDLGLAPGARVFALVKSVSFDGRLG
jgi:molybdate transport system ATP-binding protein